MVTPFGKNSPPLGDLNPALPRIERPALAGDAFEAELRDFLAPNLSKIKMPKLFDFRPDLPREANGKLYKRELRDEFAAKAN